MRVLHVLQSGHFSGAENVACQIIKMTEHEDALEMAYCSKDGSIRDALAEMDIKFYPMKKLCVSGLRKAIKNYKPDVIHAHDMMASCIAAVTAPGLPIVSHIHNSDFNTRRVSVKSLAYLLCSPRFSNIIWVSNSCYREYVFHKYLSAKSKILYNTLNWDSIKKKADSDSNNYDFDAVYIGRLANPKNPMRFVEIINLLKKQLPDVKAAFVGRGDLENEAKQLAAEYKLENNITFLGFMSNPLKVLKCAKVLCITSDREGTPMVSLEAMSLGVPIVSTPTDGLCDLVKPGITGYLENEDSKFAERLFEIISDVKLQKALSKGSLEQFSKINDVRKYKEVLNEVYGR